MFLEQVKNGFSIAIRAKTMTLPFKFVTKRAIVINLAIENDPERLILVGNWLSPPAYINDGKAAMAQARVLAKVEALVVRSAADERTRHGTQVHFINGFASNDSANSAHVLSAVQRFSCCDYDLPNMPIF